MPVSYITSIRNGLSEMDAEDFFGQPALAGTDNEPADLATVAELYDMVDAARRRPAPKAKTIESELRSEAEAIVFDMEAILIARADGEVPLTDDEFVAFCHGIAAEPF